MLAFIRQHQHSFAVFLILAAAFLYLGHIGSYHLIDPDEGRYHRVAMEMVLSGDYLTPHFDYMPYFEKPIFEYWATALAMNLFGIQEFTGRVLPALTGLGTVFLAYALGQRMYNRRTGLIAAIILATSALNLVIASIGIMDMALTFFIDACFVCFYFFERTEKKRYLLLFYAAMACGMLTKGLIAIVFPFGIIFWYALITRRSRLFCKLFYLPGILLFFVLAGPWYYLVCQANPDFFYFFFIREHFLRFATKMHSRFHPWYYFVPFLLAGFTPWTGFLLTLLSKKGIIRHSDSKRHQYDMLYLVLWAGLIYLFYSVSDSKLPTYILPCWLPLSVLLAASLERCREVKSWLGHSFAINCTLCLLFTAAGVGVLMFTDYLSVDDFLHSGALLIAALFFGTLLAIFVWRRRRSFTAVLCILSCMSYVFALGAHQVQGQIHNHQTAYYVSQQIKAMNVPESTPIIMYGEFMPGLVYYLNRPIAAANFMGELNFGIHHTDRTGMYYGSEDLAALWQSEQKAIVVVQPKELNEVLSILPTTPKQRIDLEDYTILINQEGDQRESN